jgi:cellulose synthase/poly-beta-1,6-N-acetylglucosamine synthase-like glycosyltransferase
MNRNARIRNQMPHDVARPLSRGQFVFFTVLALLTAAQLYFLGATTVFTTLVGCITVFYALFVGLKVTISCAAKRAQEWIDRLNALRPLDDTELGKYAVFVPAYDESKDVLKRVTDAIKEMDYPAHLVTVFLLMEKKDPATIAAFNSLNLGPQFVGVESPNVAPFTKPKACNIAFREHVFNQGFKFLVIFDAEDRPDLSQMRKAATAFDYLQQLGQTEVACLQAELAFWNPRSSRTSTFMWGEYSVHFNTNLRGLDQLGLIPPLGGTSNHFLVSALEKVAIYNGERTLIGADGTVHKLLGPWVESNVTEDADLAMRLYRLGYRVRMLNSVTFEEAPKDLLTANNQRTRWQLGFIQTFFAWFRQVFQTIREVGFIRWFCFELLIGGTPLSLFLNPITWGATLTYIAARLANATEITLYMERLFPGPIYYIGMLVAVGGNFFLWLQKLMVPVRRQELSERIPTGQMTNKYAEHLAAQEYGLAARLFLTPLWWAFTSIPSWRAVIEFVCLVLGVKVKWRKTPHGKEMHKEDQLTTRNAPKQLTANRPSSTTIVTPHREGELDR